MSFDNGRVPPVPEAASLANGTDLSGRFGLRLAMWYAALFIGSAFTVVLISGRLQWFEVVGVLARDIGAAFAFAGTAILRRPASIPARLGGKIVTIGQLLTLLAFLLESPYLRPVAWASGAIALYAIWDYQRVATRERREL